MAKVPFVHSGYERKENDDYQTVDPRCVQALIESARIGGRIVDICGSHGSSIVSALNSFGFKAEAAPEAFVKHQANWLVTNPPYARAVVDKFAEHALAHIQNGLVDGVAFLMRANWDFASRRSRIFDSPLYRGQIRMRFRPWWSEERSAQPIHNYVWHIWDSFSQHNDFSPEPTIVYWPAPTNKHSTKFSFQSI